MIGHEGIELTCSLQCCAISKLDCGKASKTGHEGKEVTTSVQCCAVN